MTDSTLDAIHTVDKSLERVYTDCMTELLLLSEINPALVREVDRAVDSARRSLDLLRLDSQISSLHAELALKQLQEG